MNFNMAFQDGQGNLAGFDAAIPAPEYEPLPPGVYTAKVLRGELVKTRAGADAYRITLEVLDAPFAGRRVARTWTFSPAALPYTKRDLGILGLQRSEQLRAPFPPLGSEHVVRLTIALRRGDDGRDWNDIKRIELLAVTESPVVGFLLPTEEAKGAEQ
mgnify:CR=1 FL=1|uniref:DUF669 domain-containing protein n=1 Tax=Schlesneria paludicola TaxID=360056 RepID=A0A7C4QML0_9PLAN